MPETETSATSVVLDLEIDNVYGGKTVRTTERVQVEIRKREDIDDYDWSFDQIFPATGTGNTEGDAGYFVEVLTSDEPDLIPVGTTWEFGT